MSRPHQEAVSRFGLAAARYADLGDTHEAVIPEDYAGTQAPGCHPGRCLTWRRQPARRGDLPAEGRMEVPEVALEVTCAVFAHSVWLIGRLFDDVRAGSQGPAVMGVSVVHTHHRHAGDGAQRGGRGVARPSRVQPDNLAARPDLGVYDALPGVAGNRAGLQTVDAHQV